MYLEREYGMWARHRLATAEFNLFAICLYKPFQCAVLSNKLW